MSENLGKGVCIQSVTEIFSIINIWLFTDGRSLRHKYFKDYKDYLGK